MKTNPLLCFILLPLVFCAGCFPLHYKGSPYEGSYSGLRERWNETTNKGTLRIIMVHGMSGFGTIVPGYGDELAKPMAKRFQLSDEQDNFTNQFTVSNGVTNFLRTFDFSNKSHDTLAFYELTWSPMTTQIKDGQFAKDYWMDRNRLLGNKKLKGLVNSGFGDAMLYLNPTYRTNLQEPVLHTLAAVESDMTNEHDRVVFITHSLGSKLTYDTIMDNTNNPAVTNLVSKTTDIIMLANQIPLLDLAIETNELAWAAGRVEIPRTNSLHQFLNFVGEQKSKKHKGHSPSPLIESTNSTVRVVAATDPNDDLSYPLEAGTSYENGTLVVISDIYKYNAWGILGLVECPPSAHTDYFVNDSLIKKLIEGFPKRGGRR